MDEPSHSAAALSVTAAPASPSDPAHDADDDALTKLHPNYTKVVRIRTALACLPALIGALVLETAAILPAALIITPVTLLALAVIFRLPLRRYQARGYAMSDDRLRVVRGVLFRADTVVPFGRIQHIDVDQGPLERFYDIATLTVHTAGSHAASVQLPGLEASLAMDMREKIRSHIKRESR